MKNHTKHPLYPTWRGMKARCYDKNHRNYQIYGGRGITVCNRWLNSFDDFCNDMGEKPNKEYTIDRINSNGNYEPGNCRWATKSEQDRNRRDNKYIEYDGLKLTYAEWDNKLGFNKNTITNRIKRGWSPTEALTTPMNCNYKFIEYNGLKLNYTDWERKLGFRSGTIKERISKLKWTPIKAITTPIALGGA